MDSWKELFGKTYEEIQAMKKTTPAGEIEPGRQWNLLDPGGYIVTTEPRRNAAV